VKRVLAGLTIGAAVTFAVSSVGQAASPKVTTKTLHFYGGKNVVSSFTTASGAPLGTNANAAAAHLMPGDQILSTNNLYTGNHTHHAKNQTASAALHCVVTTAAQSSLLAACEGVISIGGSMLLAIGPQNFASNSVNIVFPITGGTGIYDGATGKVVITSIESSSNLLTDFTITVTTH
jgi:hypothetical protein